MFEELRSILEEYSVQYANLLEEGSKSVVSDIAISKLQETCQDAINSKFEQMHAVLTSIIDADLGSNVIDELCFLKNIYFQDYYSSAYEFNAFARKYACNYKASFVLYTIAKRYCYPFTLKFAEQIANRLYELKENCIEFLQSQDMRIVEHENGAITRIETEFNAFVNQYKGSDSNG